MAQENEAHCKLENITEELVEYIRDQFENMKQHPLMEGVIFQERFKHNQYSFHYWCPEGKMAVLECFVTNCVNREKEMREARFLRSLDNNTF